jgi:tRNA pseudouridine38-40 synthase
LHKALNALLPPDIRVLDLSLRSFHPTLDATGKEYHYKISPVPVQDPQFRLYAWHLFYPVTFEHMQEAAQHLIGTHDFSAFANEKEDNPICTLRKIEIHPTHFVISGNRFLYKMVRNLIGTLVYVGYGKLHPNDVPLILASRDRKSAGITAPAHGLYLHQVFY